MPFAKPDAEPVYLTQMKALLKRHPKTSIIWAHIGLGRIVHPVQVVGRGGGAHADQLEIVEAMLTDPALAHVNFDISWDEVAKYAVATPEADRARGGRCSTSIPIASCSAPTRWRPPAPPVLRGVRHVGAGLEPADARGQPESAEGQLRADLRRGAPAGARLGNRRTCANARL